MSSKEFEEYAGKKLKEVDDYIADTRKKVNYDTFSPEKKKAFDAEMAGIRQNAINAIEQERQRLTNIDDKEEKGGGGREPPPKKPKGEKGPGFFSRLGSRLSSGGGGSNSGSYVSDGEGGIGILFILALAAHLYDYFTGFQRPGFMLYFYIAFILFAFFYTFKMRVGGDETKILIACAIAYLLPLLIKLFTKMNVSSKIGLTTVGIVAAFPILVIYLGLKFSEGSLIRKLTVGYILLWCILIIFLVVSTYAPDQDTKVLVQNPSSGVKYVMSLFGKTFSKAYGTFDSTLDRAVAKALGQPYEGNEESEAGIYIEDVHPLETRYTTSSEVYVEATIKAVNIKEAYTVNVICYIDGLSQGIADPAIMYGVTEGYENIIGCNLGQLKTGTYDVVVKANFEYETTSDITYTFINSKLRSDQFDKLGIETDATATYTGGPVELGLPSRTQPIRVTVDDTASAQSSSYPFGVSLKNNWAQGEVVKGKAYILDVPKEVTLVDCSRDPVSKSEPDPETGRNTYRFEMTNESIRDSFDAVTCRMNFTDIKGLLESGVSSTRTFAAKARYQYAVEETTTVDVEEN